jgi:cytochrome c oxidase subunit 2
VLAGCNTTFGATKGQTTQANLEFRLWYWMMIAGIAVAIFVWALIFWAIFRYRRRNDTIPKQTHEHIPLEITYTIIPLLMVFVIFGAGFIVENKVDNVLTKPAVIINVTAYQWGWIFQYSKPNSNIVVETAPSAHPTVLPQPYTDTALYPQMVVPEGETVRIFLRSQDVIHGFYVHAFNFSRYAQPGVTNEFEFKPTQTGYYAGQCTQYCGLYHSEMLFSVHVVTPSQFQTWVSQQEQKLSTAS